VSDADALKLTTYFGERDRAGERFLADALVDLYARHRLRTSLVMRGVEGFGVKHHLHTDRLLTLSEDLPMVSVAVDLRARIEATLDEVVALSGDGLITLERARLPDVAAVADVHEETKLTVYLGRGERAGGRPAHMAVLDALHRHGVAGATVLLGVDGTAHGERRRARFFAANAQVPLMVVAVGAGERIAAALPELRALLAEPLVTLERVRVCKRDGRRLAVPEAVAPTDPSGLAVWQKLMVYCGEQARHAQRPLYVELVRALRTAGAAGATALRGIWGYHGDHAPHGDSVWQLRRRVPVVTVIVDTPERIGRWFAVVDELTDETGLVTSEQVPAVRATGPGIARGGLRLADPGVR
jgi:PII-like signaling protein